MANSTLVNGYIEQQKELIKQALTFVPGVKNINARLGREIEQALNNQPNLLVLGSAKIRVYVFGIPVRVSDADRARANVFYCKSIDELVAKWYELNNIINKELRANLLPALGGTKGINTIENQEDLVADMLANSGGITNAYITTKTSEQSLNGQLNQVVKYAPYLAGAIVLGLILNKRA